jgi:uncharacterized membrane protein YcjF (UPF0283 family)
MSRILTIEVVYAKDTAKRGPATSIRRKAMETKKPPKPPKILRVLLFLAGVLGLFCPAVVIFLRDMSVQIFMASGWGTTAACYCTMLAMAIIIGVAIWLVWPARREPMTMDPMDALEKELKNRSHK